MCSHMLEHDRPPTPNQKKRRTTSLNHSAFVEVYWCDSTAVAVATRNLINCHHVNQRRTNNHVYHSTNSASLSLSTLSISIYLSIYLPIYLCSYNTHVVVSQNKGTLTYTPIYYNPYCRDHPKSTPIFGNPPYMLWHAARRTTAVDSSAPGSRSGLA